MAFSKAMRVVRVDLFSGRWLAVGYGMRCFLAKGWCSLSGEIPNNLAGQGTSNLFPVMGTPPRLSQTD